MPIDKTKSGYNVYGYGQGGNDLVGLTRSELFELRAELLAAIYDSTFDEFGEALKKMDDTIKEVCGA